MDTQAAQNINQEAFHFGHLKVVLMAALVLVGISWMKDPALFSNFKNAFAKHPQSVKVAVQPVHRYVPYEQSLLANQPQVAGAEISQPYPSVINEDGTVTAMDTGGAVLGAQTTTVSSETNMNDTTGNVDIRQVSDSEPSINSYYEDSAGIEQDYFTTYDFEQAIQSKDPKALQAEINKINSIVRGLTILQVPSSFVQFHKDKVANYQAAADLLSEIKKSADPQTILDAFSRFSQTAQQLQDDNTQLNIQFDLSSTQP